MGQREIERNPSTPKLSDRAMDLLAKLCFRKNDRLEEVDLIFMFSTAAYLKNAADHMAAVLGHKITSRAFITGGVPRYADSSDILKPESLLVLDKIRKDRFPEVQFFHEEKSQNTLENLTEALKILDFRDYSKILFISKAHAAGRAYLTLRKHIPNAMLFQQAYSVRYPESNREITSENWRAFEFGRKRVWGEFLRIKKYGERSDIAYDEVRDAVEEIKAEAW